MFCTTFFCTLERPLRIVHLLRVLSFCNWWESSGLVVREEWLCRKVLSETFVAYSYWVLSRKDTTQPPVRWFSGCKVTSIFDDSKDVAIRTFGNPSVATCLQEAQTVVTDLPSFSVAVKVLIFGEDDGTSSSQISVHPIMDRILWIQSGLKILAKDSRFVDPNGSEREKDARSIRMLCDTQVWASEIAKRCMPLIRTFSWHSSANYRESSFCSRCWLKGTRLHWEETYSVWKILGRRRVWNV